MAVSDDDLKRFEDAGAPALPTSGNEGFLDHDGARLWHASYGAGHPVILLHGGLGHGGNWGYQLPALIEGGYRVVLIDSRGHGRSTRDVRPYRYELMASDVIAVMNSLGLQKAAFVGWSDGACAALILAREQPARSAGVFFFACNMDPSGARPFELTPVIERCFSRHSKDYAALSSTPNEFQAFVDAVSSMQKSEPNYTPEDLGEIGVPVAVVQGMHDEFIKRDHAEFLARSIPGATLTIMPEVSHFAPLQRPSLFNDTMLRFLAGLRW